jgi:phytoene dehydrogenase-like protein
MEDVIATKRASAAGRLHEPVPFWAAIPSASDATQAPEGQDTLYLWVDSAPSDLSKDVEVAPETVAKAALAHAAEYYDGIESLEIGRRVESPAVVFERTGATNGSWSHVDLRPFRTGPLRPARGLAGYKTPVPNLFLTGAGTHPSAGVCGIPGQLAARTVLQTLRK